MRKILNFASMIAAGLIIAAFVVADKGIGMTLGAIAIGIIVFLAIVSPEFRGKF